mgnify:CR=1 FL=1
MVYACKMIRSALTHTWRTAALSASILPVHHGVESNGANSSAPSCDCAARNANWFSITRSDDARAFDIRQYWKIWLNFTGLAGASIRRTRIDFPGRQRLRWKENWPGGRLLHFLRRSSDDDRTFSCHNILVTRVTCDTTWFYWRPNRF